MRRSKRNIGYVAVGMAVTLLFACMVSTIRQRDRKREVLRALESIGYAVASKRLNDLSEHLRQSNSVPAKWLEDPIPHPHGRDSWRFHLLAYMESSPPETFFGTWETSRYREYPHPSFCITGHKNGAGCYTTNTLAITGPGTLAESSVTVWEKDAILVVVANDTALCWGKSGDLAVDADGILLNEWPGPIWGRWIGLLFADHRVWLLKGNVPLQKLSLFFTVESARKHSADEVLGQYKIEEYFLDP